jgi:hypothetical protein
MCSTRRATEDDAYTQNASLSRRRNFASWKFAKITRARVRARPNDASLQMPLTPLIHYNHQQASLTHVSASSSAILPTTHIMASNFAIRILQ